MSRFTRINEISKSVTGTFALYDFLSINTVSGSIDIMINPQPASPSSNAPAELHLDTVSGSIRVTVAPFLRDPHAVIPERIFRSSIKSMSGSISAALIHNDKTSLSTMSGRIETSLHPLSRPSSMSQVDLRCMSGSIFMTLHPYVDSPRASLQTVSADCSSRSGGLKICFPSTWEGKVCSSVNKDRVRHEWEGLRVQENGAYFAATKGDGLGRLSFSTSTGNVDLMGTPHSPEETGGTTDSPGRTQLQKGELKPDIPREGEQQQMTESEDDEDDWTVVENEDGGQEAIKRPPPSYDDATRT